ncbi:AraC family transcriptional regulator [Vibrio sp. MarTm2]|uniref:helix-turn-helix domain-containing protein n=1 Tax=Vibrio sp. MarTm2 TaxID=2998831 RepID=UPI0022CD3BF1|nr:AraC family transcriptional regulator [Vibrio sp. MarTm2]MDA0129691.1 AraC family transcriptional regulator [Vibrio sp. MarTm2]
MNVLHSGYWLGQSTSFIPKDILRDLGEFFDIKDYGYDVSVLSEPNIHFCFFHYQPSFDALFVTAAKLCQNLDKSLVVLHNGPLRDEIASLDVVIKTYDVSASLENQWAKNLSQQIHYQFTKHQEILEIHKLTSMIKKQNVSKDLIEILRYIDKNLSRTIREEDIAEYCHYSVTYFSKFFHKNIGVSFRDYLVLKRINLAKQLLTKERKEKISFIAFQCGYHDVSYFSRIFKKKTGLSPAVYRQLH